jgi:type IV secretory pathway TrbD component
MTTTSSSDRTTVRPVHKALHRPLTLGGIDRRLFFLSLLMGAATFNLLYSFLAGLLVFSALYAFGAWATRTDPKMLNILLSSSRFRPRYDPAKYARAPDAMTILRGHTLNPAAALQTLPPKTTPR